MKLLLGLAAFLLSVAAAQGLEPARGHELVDVIKLLNGSFKTVRTRLTPGNACPGVRFGGRLYESIATANAALVDRCHRDAPLGANLRARRELKELCLRPALYQHAYPNFQLSNEKDGIHFAYQLRLRMDGLDERARADTLLGMRACAQKIRGFWGRYGIKFELGVEPADGPSSLDGPSETVTMADEACRAEEDKICMRGRHPEAPLCEDGCRSALSHEGCLAQCKAARWNVICLTMLHESGHHLGLPDEYEDAVCTDRTTLSQDQDPWSVMDDQSAGWDHIEFFPRHLSAILGELCP